jgi:hypothetical protein
MPQRTEHYAALGSAGLPCTTHYAPLFQSCLVAPVSSRHFASREQWANYIYFAIQSTDVFRRISRKQT